MLQETFLYTLRRRIGTMPVVEVAVIESPEVGRVVEPLNTGDGSVDVPLIPKPSPV